WPKLVNKTSSIGDQSAGGDEEAFVVDRRQFMPCRQRDDQITTDRGQSACRHYQPAIWGARKVRDCTLDLARVAQFDRLYIYAGRRGHKIGRASCRERA